MTPRNTLIIMSDEHQARALGCAGHEAALTPHLDRLAARGLRFTSAVTPSPICVPARAAFATGQPVFKCKYWDNAFGYDGRVRGWGHALQEAGVPVESVGKLHYQDRSLPTGFDVEHIPMHLHAGVGMVWASIRDPLIDAFPGGRRMFGEYIGPGESTYTRYDDAITAHAIDWLRAHSGRTERPWCLYVGLVAPHFPLVVPAEWFDLYVDYAKRPRKLGPGSGHVLHPWLQSQQQLMDNEASFRDPHEREAAIAAYFGLVSWLDWNIGRLIAALDETGLAATTRVIYTSDHGDNVGARGLWGKSNLYRESVDVPLIMAGPEIAPGICETPVSLIDLAPTILASVGLDPAVLPDAEGRSLFDIAIGPAEPDRVVVSEYHALGSNTAGYMLRRGRWKYHHYVRFPPELFDLAVDPEETTDLAGDPAFADILRDLGAELSGRLAPDAVDLEAKRDQAALIARVGGPEAALELGAAVASGTPAPKTEQPTTRP